jgi:HK97 family phage portal protein
MKLFGYEIRKTINEIKEDVELRSIYDNYDQVNGLGYSLGIPSFKSTMAPSKALTLSAVFRAVNLISDAIASLQLKVYAVDADEYKSEIKGHNLYSLLSFEPNSLMSRFDFFKLIIHAMLLRGNAYIKINRDKDFNVINLEFINPDSVTIQPQDGDLKFAVAGVKGLINNSDMIHIRNFPQLYNHYGMSTISYAFHSLEISYNSENHARNYFKGGANSAALLTSDISLTPQQQQALIKSLKDASNAETGNPNGISIIGGVPGAKVQSLGISPKDSQLLESRQFNVLDIARFFNVNPILLFDVSKSSFNNIENAQLDFLNTTLLPILEKLENEFQRKLILPSERLGIELRFDLSNMLRADMNSQATFCSTLFGMGVVSANQIAKIFNLPKIKGVNGDEHFISTNLQQINNMIVNQNNSIDNKLKGNNNTNNTDNTEDPVPA